MVLEGLRSSTVRVQAILPGRRRRCSTAGRSTATMPGSGLRPGRHRVRPRRRRPAGRPGRLSRRAGSRRSRHAAPRACALRLPPGAVVGRLTAAWLWASTGGCRRPVAAADRWWSASFRRAASRCGGPAIRCYVAALADDVCELGGIPVDDAAPDRASTCSDGCGRTWLWASLTPWRSDRPRHAGQLLVTSRGFAECRHRPGTLPRATRRAADGVVRRVVAPAAGRRRRVSPSNGADRGPGRRGRGVCTGSTWDGTPRRSRSSTTERTSTRRRSSVRHDRAGERSSRDVRLAGPRGRQGRGPRVVAGAGAGARRVAQPSTAFRRRW